MARSDQDRAMMHLFRSLCANISHFRDDIQGNVAPIFALAIIPVLGLTGSAVDYSRANSIKSAMQAAADATALNLVQNAASLPNGDVSDTATPVFRASFSRPDATQLQVSAQSTSAGVVTVTATAQMATSFMGALGVTNIAIGSRTAATKTPGDGKGCVLALDRAASGAITAQGSTIINLIGCSMYDNSRSSTALTVGGSAQVAALSVGVVGGVSGNAAVTTTAGLQTGLSPIADPYARLQVPSFSGCDDTNYSAKNKVTIDPGVYCGGMQFNANADVTFRPGVYFIDGGGFTVNGGAQLQGTGVTFIFTSSGGGNWPTATINGGATIDLRPPSTGAMAGILMFGDRGIPLGTTYKFNGGATQYLGGAIYFPTGDVNFSGGAGTNTNCTQLIADTITFTGNSGLAINCSGYGVKPLGVSGVRLIL
jgi:Flp pilus assembly protein TadG